MRFCEPPTLEAVQASLAGGLCLDAALIGDLQPRIGTCVDHPLFAESARYTCVCWQ